MNSRYSLEFDGTEGEIELAYRNILSIRRNFRNAHKSVVSSPVSSQSIFHMTDWTKDFPAKWRAVCSPETSPGSNVSKYATVVPTAKDALTFTLSGVKTVPGVDVAGARAHYDPLQNKSWDMAQYKDRTLEFLDVWHFPLEIPNYYGDNGFMTAGWQVKNDSTDGAQAGLAMNLHTFHGVGMRWWLQKGGDWANRAEDDTFPLIPTGVDVFTRLLVHFSPDPTLGWMELQYAGKTLKVVGPSMTPDGKGAGLYKALYGTCNATMIARQTDINLLD